MVRLGIPGQNIDGLAYADSRLATVPVIQAARQPTTSDKKFPMWCEWRVSKNPSTGTEGDFWKLVKFESNGDATWVKFGAGGGGGTVITLSDDTSTKVNPDVTGDIQLRGQNGIAVTADAPNNRLDISFSGGNTPVLSINVDASSGTGTNPVVSNAGTITISGAQVASGSAGTQGVQTESTLANQFQVQVQRSAAAASEDTTKNGLAHFDSSQFTVTNGFVQFSAATGISWVEITSASAMASVNTGYVLNNAGGVTLTLPATAAFGSVIRVAGKLGLWSLVASGGQTIEYGGRSTSAGGSLTANNLGDCVDVVCITANTTWRVIGPVGTLTVA